MALIPPSPPPTPLSVSACLQITEFIVALLHRFDFEAAQATLAQCSGVIATDFFLSSLTSDSELMESARRLLFETYCRIHQKIGLE
jgi:translation initiation factor 3 subunit E